MKRVLATGAILTIIGCRSTAPATAPERSGAPSDPPAVGGFIQEARQFTFAGARAGEGYFSQDGRHMIFQSEREPENPFYQMYVMDMKTGATRRVSPGHGKVTCGWIHPDNKRVLFSSTHADPDWRKKAQAEWEERKAPKRRYAWSFDENFDIYQADISGGNLKNLTAVKGYDAEASYSPDGKWIAFASNRAGYDGTAGAEDARAFARDPSYLMDIYIMRSDGREVKRLTTEPGYDGGPFFSPDGRRIVYRHFSADGRTAEVYSMNIDGSDRTQITRLGGMSWAPFYHPSGDYLIFASNKFGDANFELFIVDSRGLTQPVRVTALEGFDGLPVFTPDGRGLMWSRSTGKGEAQLFSARWDDALARRSLNLPPRTPRGLTPAISAADARQWVEYLSSPHFGGRLTGGPRESEYVQTLADAFRAMGLKTEIQTYEFTSGVGLGEKNSASLSLAGGQARKLALGEEWIPLSYSKSGAFPATGMVFAGYGIVAPATGPQAAYDAYGDSEVKDKWVVVFAGMPEEIGNDRRFFLHLYSRLQHKAMMARQRGAAGLVVVEDDQTAAPALKLSFEGRSEDVGLPVLRLSPATADLLFASAGASRSEWTKRLSRGETATAALAGATLAAEVDLRFTKSPARNVLASLEVPGAKSTVIVGAHLDHLGHGEQGNSLAAGKNRVHPGADDNASGVAGVMEIAGTLAHKQRTGALKLKQNVLFGLWTGEEIGVLGSVHFANANKAHKLSASLNLDMIGRYRDQVLVQGVGSAPEWKFLIERANSTSGVNALTQEDPYLPSDALTFYLKQIPSVMLFTGSHPQYHTPEDTADLINYDGLAKVAAFAGDLAESLAAKALSPVTYRKVEGGQKAHPSRGLRLYLGTIPDYTRELKAGVAISGTSKDSPAEKAGLQPGDVILEMGGMKIQNLNDYVYCLQALKANEKTSLRILRAGREQDLEITPLAKTY